MSPFWITLLVHRVTSRESKGKKENYDQDFIHRLIKNHTKRQIVRHNHKTKFEVNFINLIYIDQIVQMQFGQETCEQNFPTEMFDQSLQRSIKKSRSIRPTLLNKCTINSVSYVQQMLTEIPAIDQKTQKLDISCNLLRQIPISLNNLKELVMNRNYIQKIPEELNQIASLKILRLNNNKITVLPFLKHVKHLQLASNPVQIITSQIGLMHLQHLDFDWLPFLLRPKYQQLQDINIIQQLVDIIDSTEIDSSALFIQFCQLFQANKYPRSLPIHLFKSITKRIDFFIDYLKEHKAHINFNGMHFLGKPILQYVLDEDYSKALELFMLRKSNLNDKDIFYVNLYLACKFSRIDFFNYLTNWGIKRLPNLNKDDELIDTIISNFSLKSGSDEILQKVLKYSQFTLQNKKSYKIPTFYSQKQGENIGEALLYILKNKELRSFFDFNFGTNPQPILHFSVTSRNPQLIKLVLELSRNPFQKDFRGKHAKAIRGSMISRKILWQFEKKCLKEKFLKIESENQKIQPQNRWMQTIFSGFFGEEAEEFYDWDLTSQRLSRLDKYFIVKMEGKKKREHVRKELLKKCENERDQTGIMKDFMINLHPSTTLELWEKKERILKYEEAFKPEQSNLTQFQLFQGMQTLNVSHNYEIQKPEKKEEVKTIFSFCDRVEEDEYEREEYIGKNQYLLISQSKNS